MARKSSHHLRPLVATVHDLRDHIHASIIGEHRRPRWRRLLESFDGHNGLTIAPDEFATQIAQAMVITAAVWRHSLAAAELRSSIVAPVKWILAQVDSPLVPVLQDAFGLASDDHEFQLLTKSLANKIRRSIAAADCFDDSGNACPDGQLLSFYEQFLTEYNHAERRRWGVYYTPPELVDAILAQANNAVQDRFHLARGLADRRNIGDTSDKISIFDPAVGTCAFQVGLLKHLHRTIMNGRSQRNRRALDDWNRFGPDQSWPPHLRIRIDGGAIIARSCSIDLDASANRLQFRAGGMLGASTVVCVGVG